MQQSSQERYKIETIFNDISENGLLSGVKAKEMMLQTNIPLETLAQIWDMSDLDKDGSLNLKEFYISMFLINKAKIGPLPKEVPKELLTSTPDLSKRSFSTSSQSSGDIKTVKTSPIKLMTDSSEKAYAQLCDPETGLIDGLTCRNLFLQSSLPQLTLAHIWNICDPNLVGALDKDHFKLAWFLIHQKVKNNIEPPSQSYPELIELAKHFNPEPQITLTQSDLEKLDGGNEIVRLEKELAQLKENTEKLLNNISERETELRTKSEEYNRLKHEIEAGVGESVKLLESEKEKNIQKIDMLLIREKKNESQITELKNNISVLEPEIEDLQKLLKSKSNMVDVSSFGGLTTAKKSISELETEKLSLLSEIEQLEKDLMQFNNVPSFGSLELSREDPFQLSNANFNDFTKSKMVTTGFEQDPFA